MRLGGQTCILKKGSNVFRMYKKNEIVERHRHRYEVNPEFREGFNTKGMNIVGTSVDDMLVENDRDKKSSLVSRLSVSSRIYFKSKRWTSYL